MTPFLYMIKNDVQIDGFFDTDRHKVNWHFATHEAVWLRGLYM